MDAIESCAWNSLSHLIQRGTPSQKKTAETLNTLAANILKAHQRDGSINLRCSTWLHINCREGQGSSSLLAAFARELLRTAEEQESQKEAPIDWTNVIYYRKCFNPGDLEASQIFQMVVPMAAVNEKAIVGDDDSDIIEKTFTVEKAPTVFCSVVVLDKPFLDANLQRGKPGCLQGGLLDAYANEWYQLMKTANERRIILLTCGKQTQRQIWDCFINAVSPAQAEELRTLYKGVAMGQIKLEGTNLRHQQKRHFGESVLSELFGQIHIKKMPMTPLRKIMLPSKGTKGAGKPSKTTRTKNRLGKSHSPVKVAKKPTPNRKGKSNTSNVKTRLKKHRGDIEMGEP